MEFWVGFGISLGKYGVAPVVCRHNGHMGFISYRGSFGLFCGQFGVSLSWIVSSFVNLSVLARKQWYLVEVSSHGSFR